MNDCLIIGGGVIGLSLAYELATHGLQVEVVDRGAIGREASWAGAGILPPGKFLPDGNPYDQLVGLSHTTHNEWAERLCAETGIDTGFRREGGCYLAADESSQREVDELPAQCELQQVECRKLDGPSLAALEPALDEAVARGTIRGACLLPDEGQLRNPRHLQALLVACQARGVRIRPGVEVHDFIMRGETIQHVVSNEGRLSAGAYCLAAGSWSGLLGRRLGVRLDVVPVRGQMVLFHGGRRILQRVINVGPRYFVPRPDGRVLVGSTQEHAGYDKRTTGMGIQALLAFALRFVPSLGEATLERTWAGLRPGTADGKPYLGRMPSASNAFVATGHFRSGLQLSAGTAIVMSQLIRGQESSVDLTPFRVDRGDTGKEEAANGETLTLLPLRESGRRPDEGCGKG